jgi:hypothetical protein
MNSPVLVFLAISVICISIGCSPKAAETMQTNTATYAANIKPLPSENGKRFEKEDGREIPRLGSGRLEKEYFFQTTTDTGEKIKVAVTDYETSSPDTEEPFQVYRPKFRVDSCAVRQGIRGRWTKVLLQSSG